MPALPPVMGFCCFATLAKWWHHGALAVLHCTEERRTTDSVHAVTRATSCFTHHKTRWRSLSPASTP